MTRNSSQDPHQEALIIAHPETGGMVVHSPESGPGVTPDEARLQQLNVLSLFGAMNQREMYYQYHEQRAVEPKDEPKRQAILEGIAAKRDAFEHEAETEFYKSIGLFATLDAAQTLPGFDVHELRRAARNQWTRFQASFRGMNRNYERSEYRQALLDGWTPTEINTLFSQFNRAHDLRPLISDKERKHQLGKGRDYPVLDTRQRLVAIQDDPRAGFLPTTNLEKNMVMTYLDYLDNPDYPLGITNQLFEVFIHQQRLDVILPTDTPDQRAQKRLRAQQRERSGVHMGIRAMESITYQMADFLHSSRRSLNGLLELQDFVGSRDILPTWPIGEEVPESDIGLRALIQYRHLADYRDRGRLPPGIRNPLVTKEDRIRTENERTPEDIGRNKTIEDIYTRRNMDPAMILKLGEIAHGLPVKLVRQSIADAVRDKQLRLKFYETNLERIVELEPDDTQLLTFRQIAAEELAKAA